MICKLKIYLESQIFKKIINVEMIFYNKSIAKKDPNANSVSGLSKAQTRLSNEFKPLENVKNLANAPFSGANIAKTVGNVAANYNSEYSAYILAKGTNTIVNVGKVALYVCLKI